MLSTGHRATYNTPIDITDSERSVVIEEVAEWCSSGGCVIDGCAAQATLERIMRRWL